VTHAKVLRAADRHSQRWRNGGGVTYEITRRDHPVDPDRFAWRVSIAEVRSEGPFSAFAGYQRLISVIEGQGMELTGLSEAPTLLEPGHILSFDGFAAVSGRLPRGPVKDLNVIFDPRLCQAQLSFVTGTEAVAGSEVLLINLAPQAAHWRSGAEGGVLVQFDAVLLEGVADNDPVSFSASHGAVVTLVA